MPFYVRYGIGVPSWEGFYSIDRSSYSSLRLLLGFLGQSGPTMDGKDFQFDGKPIGLDSPVTLDRMNQQRPHEITWRWKNHEPAQPATPRPAKWYQPSIEGGKPVGNGLPAGIRFDGRHPYARSTPDTPASTAPPAAPARKKRWWQ